MESKKSKFSIISPLEDASSPSIDRAITKDQAKGTSDIVIDTNTKDKSHNNQSQTTQSKMAKDFIIVWLTLNIDDSTNRKDDSVMRLRYIISGIETFTDVNKCVDFLTDRTDEKVSMIIHDYPNQNFLSLMNDIPQLYFLIMITRNLNSTSKNRR
jgi:hypothetical protein